MKIITEPKVTKVGHWVFTDHPDYEVPGDGTNMERGLAFAAKGCYDEKTEVLTENGWKYFRNLKPEEALATLNPETKELEYHVPTKYIRYNYEGDMYYVRNRGMDILVTPDHNMYVPEEGLVRADEIAGTEYLQTRTITSWKGESPEYLEIPQKGLVKTEDFMEFLGYFISEGSTYIPTSIREDETIPEGTGTCNGVIYQSEEFSKPIHDLFDRLGWNYNVQVDSRNNVLRFRFYGKEFILYLRDMFGTLSNNKKIPNSFLRLSSNNLQILLDALMYGDGTNLEGGSRVYTTTSEELAGNVQEIIIKLGGTATTSYSTTGGFYGIRESYIAKFQDININSKGRKHDGWEHYEGTVYCVTVENHILLVRRNNKIVWCGNCYQSFGAKGRPCVDNQRGVIAHGHGSVAEHATVTFYIEGVTRALTLEMNRHRPFSISQESTRYVAEEETALVLAPHYSWMYGEVQKILERNDMGLEDLRVFEHIGEATPEENRLVQTLANYLWSCKESIQEYKRQVNYLMEMNPLELEGFALRKWARGEARNILPHCIETKVTYTGNLRAWRHFLEVRSSRHAEAEIRRLCQHVYRELRDLAPVYFEDYEEVFYPETAVEDYPIYPEYVTDNMKI